MNASSQLCRVMLRCATTCARCDRSWRLARDLTVGGAAESHSPVGDRAERLSPHNLFESSGHTRSAVEQHEPAVNCEETSSERQQKKNVHDLKIDLAIKSLDPIVIPEGYMRG
jgi:hypothetical protein